MVAPDFVQRIETMPLAIVTVEPLSTNVTFGPVPVPPPGIFANRERAKKSMTRNIRGLKPLPIFRRANW
jgi:hypothetical protein